MTLAATWRLEYIDKISFEYENVSMGRTWRMLTASMSPFAELVFFRFFSFLTILFYTIVVAGIATHAPEHENIAATANSLHALATFCIQLTTCASVIRAACINFVAGA